MNQTPKAKTFDNAVIRQNIKTSKITPEVELKANAAKHVWDKIIQSCLDNAKCYRAEVTLKEKKKKRRERKEERKKQTVRRTVRKEKGEEEKSKQKKVKDEKKIHINTWNRKR